MDRTIVHFDLDSFFVSVEQLKNPSLLGKPVIVGGISDRGVVAACSYEARRFGISSAMPGKMAKRLCPDAIFIKGDWESYSKYSDMVTEIVSEKSPLVEKASIDEFYADFTGMEKHYGCYKWAGLIKQDVYKNTGLPISFGVSTSKIVSKVATGEVKPNGQQQILAGSERAFLSPLHISKMPMIGKVTGQTLRKMGINDIGTLGQMPRLMLERVFGKNGSLLWERANGIDTSPVIPYHDQKSISKEITFDRDTTDMMRLKAVLIKMVEGICFDLRQKKQCAGVVAVKIRYTNFDTHTQQVALPFTAQDQTVLDKVMKIFHKLYDRRLLIRLIGVRVSKLVPGYSQLNLFDDTATMAELYNALDKIRLKYGEDSVGSAFGMLLGEARQTQKEVFPQGLSTKLLTERGPYFR